MSGLDSSQQITETVAANGTEQRREHPVEDTERPNVPDQHEDEDGDATS